MSQTVPYRLGAMKPAEAAIPPPHDLHAEQLVLAEILCDVDGRAMPRVKDLLKAKHFISERHARIYEACEALHAAQQPTDVTAVGAHLRSTGRLEQVGGYDSLSEIERAWTVGTDLRTMAEVVFDRWRLRSVMVRCDRIRAEIQLGKATTETQEYLEKAAKSLVEVANMSPRVTGETFLDVLKRVTGAITETYKAEAENRPMPLGLSTTFPTVDEMTGGLLPGKKFTVVGLPGAGKSVIGLQVAIAAAERGLGALFFATEQDKEELTIRAMSYRSGVDARSLTKAQRGIYGALPTGEWRRVVEVMNDRSFVKMPLVLESSPSLTVDQIVTRARTMHERMPITHKVPLGLVVVDYVQRLAAPEHLRDKIRNEQVNYASKALKNLAVELGIPVLELAQQKTVNDKSGKPARPGLGMVHHSRDVDQDADALLCIWERDEGDYVLVIPKSRSGATGEVEVDFEKHCFRMRERGSGPSYDGGYYESR